MEQGAVMDAVHFLLSLAALLLWMNWMTAWLARRSLRRAAPWARVLNRATPAPSSLWLSFAALLLILTLRPVLYFRLGSETDWLPRLNLGVLTLVFRSDYFSRMEIFSWCSFLEWLSLFYFALLLLSSLNGSLPKEDAWQNFIRLHLGWIERWPAFLKLILPFVLGTLAWAAVAPLLSRQGLFPAHAPAASLWLKAALIGLSGYLSWKFVLISILAADLALNYVYLGKNSLLDWIQSTARQLLKPFSKIPRRHSALFVGHGLAIALTLLLAKAVSVSLSALFGRLPS